MKIPMPKISSLSQQQAEVVRRGERGFSLLELIVAMVIFLIVTGAIYGVLQVSMHSRSVVNEQVQLTRNMRIALNLVGRDTYNAGYGYPLSPDVVLLPDNAISTLLGIPNDADTTRDTVPPIIAGNGITQNNLDGIAGQMTDQVTFLFKDSTFNKVGPTGATEQQKVSQPLSINAASTDGGIDEIVPISGSNSVCRRNDIYLVRGNTGSTLALSTNLPSGTNKIQFSNGDVLGFNQTGSSGPLRGITVPASIMRVKMITYFVNAGGILTRREFANIPPTGTDLPTNFVDEPLIYGVENFQIQYVLNDGTLTDNPGAGIGGLTVRQVRFTVSVKSSGTDAKGQPYRETMTSTFSTRNLGYDAN